MRERIHPAIPILAVFLALALLSCCILLVEKNEAKRDAEKLRAEYSELKLENVDNKQTAMNYKASYESLLKAIEEAEQDAEEYQQNYNELTYFMINDAAEAEDLGNLIKSVWYNAIFEKSDAETDRFTKVKGKFVRDFKDALDNLLTDSDFSRRIDDLSANQQLVKKRMKDMTNPPQGYENAFRALESLYNSYLAFTNFIIRPEGSLESFSEGFSEVDDKFCELYDVAEIYVRY